MRSFKSLMVINPVAVAVTLASMTSVYGGIALDEQPLLQSTPLYHQAAGFPPIEGEDENSDIFIENLPTAPDHGDEDNMLEEVSQTSRHNKSKQKGAARHGDRDKPLRIRLEGFMNEIQRLKEETPDAPHEWHDALTSIDNRYHSVTWDEIASKADVGLTLS